ncbi:MAG TPA: arsenite methyltransferase [Thermodesulfobacteriota bacterium]|nr:arsenite methyltransferase [Thermodesulfobacteriota bacterium]
MSKLEHDEIRREVRKQYGKVAVSEVSGCECNKTWCCDAGANADLEDYSAVLGYSKEDIALVPEGANMGLGCGNPQAIASLRKGETVLDLGSGGGFDCFLAARQVGDSGLVIGVDMTPEMVSKARQNAAKGGFENVEFRLGEIENLPVADNSVDVIISNCVINLSPDKQRVFNEAFRVLKSGGRLAVSDIVATASLPEEVKKDMALYTACMAGASLIEDVEKMLKNAGFVEIKVKPKNESREFIQEWAPGTKVEDYVVSATIEAVKP